MRKVKKQHVEGDEDEDEDEAGNEDQESDLEDESSVDEKESKALGKSKSKANWIISHQPEVYRVIDPISKKIIIEAGSIEELNVKLSLITAQNSVEAAENTR